MRGGWGVFNLKSNVRWFENRMLGVGWLLIRLFDFWVIIRFSVWLSLCVGFVICWVKDIDFNKFKKW